MKHWRELPMPVSLPQHPASYAYHARNSRCFHDWVEMIDYSFRKIMDNLTALNFRTLVIIYIKIQIIIQK